MDTSFYCTLMHQTRKKVHQEEDKVLAVTQSKTVTQKNLAKK